MSSRTLLALDTDALMNKKPHRILIVDDEEDLVWALARSLGDEGYEVLTAYDGVQALATARRHHFDLIILDVVMPKVDGFQVCRELRQIRAFSSVPILFLSVHSAVADRVMGLDLGGDDYLVKPFHMNEFKGRVRALLRRGGQEPIRAVKSGRKGSVLQAGPLTLFLETREVRVRTTTAMLTPREFDLLHHLMIHFGEVLSSKELLQQVWGYPAESNCTSLVRWHVKSLREKIEPVPSRPVYLRTVPRHGYTLKPE